MPGLYLKQISTLAEGRSWSEETSSARNYERPMQRSSSNTAPSRMSNGTSSMSQRSSSPELILGMSKYDNHDNNYSCCLVGALCLFFYFIFMKVVLTYECLNY